MPDIEKFLFQKSQEIKKVFLNLYYKANAGHIGSSLSVAEILTVVWFELKTELDKVILSKGHAAAALYATLYSANKITEETLMTFYENNTILPAHPPVNHFEDIPFATGSLGHGLSMAAGFGLSQKLKSESGRVFCITSDGELNEGSTWEAALFINHHKLHNVVWIIDRNYLQGFGKTEDVLSLEPLDKKLESFGFEVFKINGHNINELLKIHSWQNNCTKPLAIIAETIKGNGWEKLNNSVDSHYLPMKIEDFHQLQSTLSHES